MALCTWLSSALVRHFPATPARQAAALRLEAARNERVSAQVAMRWEPEPADTVAGPIEVRVEAEAPAPWRVRVRRVGFVPVRHHNTNMPVDELDGPIDSLRWEVRRQRGRQYPGDAAFASLTRRGGPTSESACRCRAEAHEAAA